MIPIVPVTIVLSRCTCTLYVTAFMECYLHVGSLLFVHCCVFELALMRGHHLALIMHSMQHVSLVLHVNMIILWDLSYSPSASLADMPVAPYPVDSKIGTLSPSSSSELRLELTSGSSKESVPSRMSSSMGISTWLAGLTLSTGGPVSQSNAQNNCSEFL
ncbi:hypothetical protein RJT34_14037 [Clitoria ternatea]|uniref:Uncharacterized protein n=1 Tax=Clitoria ternatea TaxID=43366 RepID=A0AAN9JS66_CLITE